MGNDIHQIIWANTPYTVPKSFKINDLDAKAAVDFDRILNDIAKPEAAKLAPQSANEEGNFSLIGFIKGILDIINPLQHIPVVNTIYRHLTGDEISPAAKIAGGALYGGPVGGALAGADVAFATITGKDAGETVMAALAKPAATETQLAASLNNTVQPASGMNADDIFWFDTPQKIRKEFTAAKTAVDPAPPAIWSPTQTVASPVRTTRDTVSAVPTPMPTAAPAGSTTVPLLPQAPARDPRTDPSPEFLAASPAREAIAAQMMAALDQYGAMKSAGLQPSFSHQY